MAGKIEIKNDGRWKAFQAQGSHHQHQPTQYMWLAMQIVLLQTVQY